MSSSVHQEDYCLNCKTTLQGEYCHRCGQKRIKEHDGSFLHTMLHFLGDFVHYDSQVFRTAKPLLLKPGFLVNEYLNGKRARYLPPIRMYVFLSFLFFFLTFTFSDLLKKPNGTATGNDIITFDVKDEVTGKTKKLTFSELSDTLSQLQSGNTDSVENEKLNLSQNDSVQSFLSVKEEDNWWMTKLKMKSLNIIDKISGKERVEFIKKMTESFLHNFPKILFFLLPVFALLLKLLYRKRYYMDHLIFSVTFYNFFFLFGSLLVLIRLIPCLEGVGDFLYMVAPLVYLFLSMRNVYRESKLKTAVKFGIFFITFSIFLGIGLLMNVLITMLSV